MGLANSRFEPPNRISDNLKFSPSPFCEASVVSFYSSYSPATTTSADFLYCFQHRISPGKCILHFTQSLWHLLSERQVPLGRCKHVVAYPFSDSLICPSCLSVPGFAVWLPSLCPLPDTSLPLANDSDTTPLMWDFPPD